MKNKLIDLINSVMSKCHFIFTEKFITIFSNTGKTGNVSEFEFKKI